MGMYIPFKGIADFWVFILSLFVKNGFISLTLEIVLDGGGGGGEGTL